MAGEVKVTLIKDTNAANSASSSNDFTDRYVDEPVSELTSPVYGTIIKYASLAAITKAAYDMAKKTYERLNTIEKEGRLIEDNLRNYGGAGFSANTIGDRFNVFGKRIDGESVAYKK